MKRKFNASTFTSTSPLPVHFYGKLSPLLVAEDVEMDFTFDSDETLGALEALAARGGIPTDAAVLDDFKRLDLYFDVPLLKHIIDDTWSELGDDFLWFYKLRGFQRYTGSTNNAAKNGNLETLKWIHTHVDEITTDALDFAAENGKLECLKWIYTTTKLKFSSYTSSAAAENGHLECLKWIIANGGKLHVNVADLIALNGHLECLKWVRAHSGTWTLNAANNAARNGHLETLKWIMTNGGNWSYVAADNAAENGHFETLKWIRANGGRWTSYAADIAAGHGHLEMLMWVLDNGGKCSENAKKFATMNGHMNVINFLKVFTERESL